MTGTNICQFGSDYCEQVSGKMFTFGVLKSILTLSILTR